MLTAQDLHDAFMELGARARREGKVIDLAIYRGSALIDHARKLREQGESPAQAVCRRASSLSRPMRQPR